MKGVTIGSHVWKSEDLVADCFRNGDPIYEATDENDLSRCNHEGVPAFCRTARFEDNADPAAVYGFLYNSHALLDPRGLAPEGWRVPSDEDWQALINFCGGFPDMYQNKMVAGGKLKYSSGWLHDQESTNESRLAFHAVGLPFINNLKQKSRFGFWWSSTQIVKSDPSVFMLNSRTQRAALIPISTTDACAVRLVRDNVVKQNITRFNIFDWKNSLYYPGAGIDIQPLLRFSHLTTSFLHVNLFMTKEDVLEGLFRSMRKEPLLEINKVIDYNLKPEFWTYEGMGRWVKELSGWFQKDEKRAYESAFRDSAYSTEVKWLLEFQLTRKDTGRKLRLIYMHAEGLAAYVYAAKAMGPPKILCTVQTEVMEQPNELMTRFMDNLEQYPEIWVRGFAPDRYLINYNTVHGKDERFPVHGGDFLFPWKVNSDCQTYTYTSGGSERYCRCFIRRETRDSILAKPFRSYGENSIRYGHLYSMVLDAGKNDTFVLTDNVIRKYQMGDLGLNLVTMEELLGGPPSPGKTDVFFGRLKELADRAHGPVWFLPMLLEDQGILLDRFLTERYAVPLHAILGRPLDLMDLREHGGG